MNAMNGIGGTMALSKLKAVPLTLAQANHYVGLLHRHHKPCTGHRFSIGCMNEQFKIVGVCIAGRPVSSSTNQEWVLEVSRIATDGTPNACSFLCNLTLLEILQRHWICKHSNFYS